MKFIVDAQLPKSLSDLLNRSEHNSVHTLELPEKNRTSDQNISQIANGEDRIVITKDTDFLDSYLVYAIPEKLILVKTGNIKNIELLQLFTENLPTIIKSLSSCNFIEITKDEIISHS